MGLTMAATLYKPGDRVERSGVYRAIHALDHVERQEVIILRARSFPSCRRCGAVVRFEPIHLAQEIDAVPCFNPSAKGPASKRRIAT